MSVFAAVSDPKRREMLGLLAKGPKSAGEIVSHFSDLTQPGVSRHLRVLREAQLVEVTPDAQQRIYALKQEGFRELSEWLSRYEDFWSSRLDALGEHLDKVPHMGRRKR
ncbi:MAG: ArsR/SmtB family transcription factor [Nitrososphaerales archaeon]